MKHFTIILLIAAAVMHIGCSNEDVPQFESQLVLDAWIDSDGFPVAILSRTLSPSAENVELADAVVRWGKVTISDGIEEITLTGGPDKKYFPPYTYKSYYMEGVPGRTYTITATDGKQTVTATSTMLTPPEIQRVDIEKIANTDSLWRASLTFTPPTDEEAYFMSFVRVTNEFREREETQYFPSFLGNVLTRGREPVTMALYQGKHRDTKIEYFNNFQTGDEVEVLLCRIDRAAYDFWEAYINAVYFENGIFVSTHTPLQGNVYPANSQTLPALGLFSARGTAEYSFTID